MRMVTKRSYRLRYSSRLKTSAVALYLRDHLRPCDKIVDVVGGAMLLSAQVAAAFRPMSRESFLRLAAATYDETHADKSK